MSNKLQELKEYLESMFELDQADLDFGIYRIMNQKREEIKDFLDNRLVPEVKEAFEQYQAADKEVVQKEIDELKQQLEKLGVAPENSEQYQALMEKLNQSVDVSGLENEVYSHLVNFFQRYYDSGDFISQRRYKKDVYAIPYEGEEVKLHWANAEQYYIKTSEYFQNYTFVLPSGKRVHFKLVDASTEKDNNKEPNGKERKFILVEDEPLVEKNGELIIKFVYHPVEGKVKQDDLNAEAVKWILNYDGFKEWRHELAELKPTKNNGERTILEKHLKDYTARNTFDYFIHKDLGGFLRRELDFYIKNEVMFLDDLDTENEVRFEQYLSKVKVIKRIASKIITFLEQLENFQKKLWLKKKFVVETNWCITLDKIDESFYQEIAANDRQRQEWIELYAIDKITDDLVSIAYSNPLTVEFLRQNKNLVLDTKHFCAEFKERLISSIDNLDKETNGLLIHSENFHALNLLQGKYKGQINCIHIDPPYNTETSGFLYKNNYKHSSWMSMMFDRMNLSIDLMSDDASFYCHIDENEYERLWNIFEETPLLHIGTIVWDKRNPMTGGAGLAIQHEYVICRSKNIITLNINNDNAKKMINYVQELISKYGGVNEDVRREYIKWINQNSSLSAGEKAYRYIDENGKIYQSVSLRAPEPRTDPKFFQPLIHPITKKACALPPNGFSRTPETLQDMIKKGEILFGTDETTQPRQKMFLSIDKKRQMTSVIQNGMKGKADTDKLGVEFPYCHPVSLYEDLVGATTDKTSIILDYFAGSGTTGHALINLNREDNGNRKYIMVEMGEYFDTVLKPRIQKVIYSKDWNSGKPVTREGTSHMFKYIRLESYEDTLNNLEPKRSKTMQDIFDSNPAFYEEYILKYMLDFETKDNASLLNIDYFKDPFNYKLNITKHQESKECAVDLVDTFNYLLGLKVDKLEPKERYNAVKDTNAERPDAVKLRRAKEEEAQFVFQVVEGVAPEGDKVLVIWRTLTGDPVLDNAALDAYFERKQYNTRDFEFKRIYVNGDNNLDNFKADQEQYKVLLIEEEFKRRMFDIQDV